MRVSLSFIKTSGSVLCLGSLIVMTLEAGTPYDTIHQRNVFHLKPAVSARIEVDRGPLPKVRLTGITTILGGKRALFKVEIPTKPPQKPKEESYILSEGQRGGPIEVLEINVRTEQVEIEDSGVITNITFEKAIASSAAASVQPATQRRGFPYRPTYR